MSGTFKSLFFFFFRDKGSSQMKELPVVALGQ